MCTLFVYTYVIESPSSVTCVLCLCVRTLLIVGVVSHVYFVCVYVRY